MAGHVCPWWVGYFLLNPFRRITQSANRVFGPYVRSGMTVLEVGPGMGFFSLDLARLVGPEGLLICVDVQQKMLDVLKRRASKAGLSERIETRLCSEASIGLDDLNGRVDLALVIFTAHEIPDLNDLFTQAKHALKPEGRLFLAEPKLHVSEWAFKEILSEALNSGFFVLEHPPMFRGRTALLAITRG